MERTFAIIKPDAVAAKHSGNIINIIEQKGFYIIGMKKVLLKQAQVELFYDIHKERPFFKDMVSFMISGPVILMVLEKDNAIKDWRTLMGATNPANAEEGTIRKIYGKSIDNNATHGSDAPETARREIAQFFPEFV